MSKITIQVEVQKETHEVGKLLADIVIAVKAKKSITQIAAEELAAFVAAIEGIDKIPAEYQESKAASLKAVLIPVSDAVEALFTSAPTAPAA